MRGDLAHHDEDDPSHRKAHHDRDTGSPGRLKLVSSLVSQGDRVAVFVQLREVAVHELPRAVARPSIKIHATVLRPSNLHITLHLNNNDN